MGGGYNYMVRLALLPRRLRTLTSTIQTYTMFDQIFWRATSAQVNRWRKKTLNLGSTSLEAMQQQQIPFLYNFRCVSPLHPTSRLIDLAQPRRRDRKSVV